MASQLLKTTLLSTIVLLIVLGWQLGTVWLVADLTQQSERTEPIRGQDPAASQISPSENDRLSAVIPVAGNELPVASSEDTKDGATNQPRIPETASAIAVGAEIPSTAPEVGPVNQAVIAESTIETKIAANEPNPKREAVAKTGSAQEHPVLSAESKSDTNKNESVTPDQEPVETGKVSESAADTPEFLNPAWVQSRDPDHYTLQIYKSRYLKGLTQFASGKALPQPLAFYKTSSKSGSWYVLVAGDFANEDSAGSALGEVNARFPKLKLWMRDFSEIQAQMR